MAQFELRDIDLDLPRYLVGKTFYLDVPQGMLEYSRVPLDADRLAEGSNVHRDPYLFGKGYLEKVGMQQFAPDGVYLVILEQGEFFLPVRKLQVHHHLLALNGVDELR